MFCFTIFYLFKPKKCFYRLQPTGSLRRKTSHLQRKQYCESHIFLEAAKSQTKKAFLFRFPVLSQWLGPTFSPILYQLASHYYIISYWLFCLTFTSKKKAGHIAKHSPSEYLTYPFRLSRSQSQLHVRYIAQFCPLIWTQKGTTAKSR